MSVAIRLQRQGRKNRPFYHIVVTDKRKKRDGRFIEKVGYYDPLANPSAIKVNDEKVSYWYKKGAQLSNTVSVLLKKLNIKLTREIISSSTSTSK